MLVAKQSAFALSVNTMRTVAQSRDANELSARVLKETVAVCRSFDLMPVTARQRTFSPQKRLNGSVCLFV